MGICCGVDIIEIDRIEQSFENYGQSFRDRVYTKREIEYCENKGAARYMSYAARFAAKEAVSKALGTGIGTEVGWKDIEILNDEKGKPHVVLCGKGKELFEKMGACSVSLSMSHCKNYAVAYAVIEVGDK